MNPRIVLKLLLERLAEVKARCADFAAWENEEVELKDRAAAGMLHLSEAASEAEAALASGDETRIVDAALICASLERTSKEIAARRDASRIAAGRQKGGKRRGGEQAQRAAAVWAPFVRQFQELLATGAKSSQARQIVKVAMRKRAFQLPDTGAFPDDRTIRKWLPAKKSERS
jgi:hypothetical protein